MAEPIKPELIQPQRLTIGETPLYLTTPLELDGQSVTQLTIKGAGTRAGSGIDSAVLLLKQPSQRRGEEGQTVSKPLTNINDMEEVAWDEKIDGLRITMADGSTHTIPKDQLSLVRPLEEVARPAPPAPEPVQKAPEPKLARTILEQYSGTPTTLTIVGLRAYETRAHDLADKAMQLKTSLGERIWKQGFGPVYFHERLRQYYLDMLRASNAPFAAESIRIAEAAATNRYNDLLKNQNVLARAGTRFVQWLKDNVGARTMVQRFALEEIGRMKESGEIKEREAFDREAASLRKRFEMDVANQDEYIRRNLGEDIQILNQPEHKPLVDEIKSVVRRWASGEIATKADFDRATDELFQTRLKGAHPDLFNQAELYASSLYEVAENLRVKAGHEGGIAAIDAQLESMQVRLGMGVMGEATALEPTNVQKGTQSVARAVQWLEKKGIVGPFLFNEATVSTGVALALSLGVLPKMGASVIVRGLGGIGAGAAFGGILGGLREYRMLEREYLTHTREREAGLTFSPDARRRAWMERFFVGQRSADDLIASIRGALYQPDGTIKASLTEEELRAGAAHLADAKARKALSAREHERNRQRIGMIQYSGRENIETQRTALDLTIAQAEKDLLESGKATREFLADVTAAQTRVLNEGVEALSGLDDPIRVTLGLLEKYNPQVDVMRRRFPLVGPEAPRGKAQGLEDILAEFRRAARGEAVKKGLVVGATAGVVGLGIRGVMEAGSFLAGEAFQQAPALSPIEIIHGQEYQFSNNLHLAGSDLVNNKGDVVVSGFKDYLGTVRGALNPDGTLSDSAKVWIADQASDHGLRLDIPEAVKTEWSFSGGTHDLADLTSGQPITAPNELHWVFTPEGRSLVMDVKDAGGNPFQQVLYSDAGHQGEISGALAKVIQHPNLLYTPESQVEHSAPFDSVRIPGLSDLIDKNGVAHPLFANIPEKTSLVELAPGSHTYTLLDNSGNPLLDGIQIDDHGRILNMAALAGQAKANGLNITMDQLPGVTTETAGGGPSGLFNIKVEDMGGERGAHGPWGWLEDPINASRDVDHKLPGTNFAKNLFRGFEENYLTSSNLKDAAGNPLDHTAYTSLHHGETYTDLPEALFSNSQLVEMGKLMDEAIQKFEVGGIDYHTIPLIPPPVADPSNPAAHDYMLRVAYELGRVGRVAEKDEIRFFLDAFGKPTEVTTPIFQPTIERIVSETVPAKITGIPGTVVTNVIALPERTTPDLSWVPPVAIPHRRPLEPMEVIIGGRPFRLRLPEVPPGMYYIGSDLQTYQEWLHNNPHLLHPYRKVVNADGTQQWVDKEGNLVKRDAARERQIIQTYLDVIRQSQPDYYHRLEALRAASTVQPMHEATRVSINIPARMEGANIYRLLEEYVQQTDENGQKLDPFLYEINVFVNRRVGEPADATIAEIQRFVADKSANGERYFINYFDAQLEPEHARVGYARKILTDLTLLRSLERVNQQQPLYIESEDADLMRIDRKAVVHLMNKLDANPHLDAVRGMQDRLPEVLMQNDYLFVNQRLHDFMEMLLRRARYRPENNPEWGSKWSFFWHRIITGGWNTGYTAEAYALIGGYDPTLTKGEDVTLGEKMTMIRGDGKIPTLEVVGKVPTRSDSSPRRFIHEILTGKGAYSDDFESEEVNRFIKTATLDQLLDLVKPVSRIEESNKQRFVDLLNNYYGFMFAITPNETEAKRLFDSLMMHIGMKKEDYEHAANRTVTIHNVSNLKAALDDYRERHQAPRKPGERTKYRTPAEEAVNNPSPSTPAT